MLKKPIKEWNVIDILIATVCGIALIPISFWVTGKSFGLIDKIENKMTNKKVNEETTE